ncbi:hypothetical protein [Weissella confusa]|nr:hypothetical protein [Weissella confusa]
MFDKFTADGGDVSFSVAHDDLAIALAKLNEAGVMDLKVTPPTLEDLFMQYYDAEDV